MTWLSDLRYNDKLPDWAYTPIYKIDNWYYEIRNRFFAKYYRIDIRNMPKGAWWDTDHRMFEVIWQLFEDFVEIEVFNMSVVCSEDTDPLKMAYDKSPKTFQFRTPKNRCPKNSWSRAFVMKHWEWEAGLTNIKNSEWYDGDEPDKLTPQAEKAIKLRELYLWWKDVRPNRPDPDFLEHDWKKASELEQQYFEEDTKMTQELIAIRGGLWT